MSEVSNIEELSEGSTSTTAIRIDRGTRVQSSHSQMFQTSHPTKEEDNRSKKARLSGRETNNDRKETSSHSECHTENTGLNYHNESHTCVVQVQVRVEQEDATITLPVSEDTTFAWLKTQLEKKVNIPIFQQMLEYQDGTHPPKLTESTGLHADFPSTMLLQHAMQFSPKDDSVFSHPEQRRVLKLRLTQRGPLCMESIHHARDDIVTWGLLHQKKLKEYYSIGRMLHTMRNSLETHCSHPNKVFEISVYEKGYSCPDCGWESVK